MECYLKQEKMKLKPVQKNFKHQMLLGCSGSRRLGRNQRKKIGRDKDTYKINSIIIVIIIVIITFL